jgi:hypothetical protein
MDDSEKLVVLAINVQPVQVPLFQEILEENHINVFVTGGNQGYGARGETYMAKGVGAYTIRVRKSDEEKAIKAMQDLGFQVLNEDDEEQNFLAQLASPTEKIPFLARYSLNVRLSIMAIALTAVITIIVLCFS